MSQSGADNTTEPVVLDEALWRDIPNQVGYQAHPAGFVRSRWKKGGDVRKYGKTLGDKWHILRGSAGPGVKWGYRQIFMGRDSSETLHRLIATTFIPNPDNKPTVNHKNGIRSDSRVENLEWATWSEQHVHKCQVLGHGRGSTNGQSKLKEEDALDIFILLGFGARGCDLADMFGVTRTTISAIKRGAIWGYLTGASKA